MMRLPDFLDSVARIRVRRNSGADVGARRRLNLIEGANVTISVTDDSLNEEIDVTISSTGGGGGGGGWSAEQTYTPRLATLIYDYGAGNAFVRMEEADLGTDPIVEGYYRTMGDAVWCYGRIVADTDAVEPQDRGLMTGTEYYDEFVYLSLPLQDAVAPTVPGPDYFYAVVNGTVIIEDVYPFTGTAGRPPYVVTDPEYDVELQNWLWVAADIYGYDYHYWGGSFPYGYGGYLYDPVTLVWSVQYFASSP